MPYCPNPRCPGVLHAKLLHWCRTLGICGLGDKLLRRLVGSGRVRDVADLYTLTTEELAETKG